MNQKIYITGIVKILRITLITFSVVYLVGTLWFCFVEVYVLFEIEHPELQSWDEGNKRRKHQLLTSFTYNNNWDISESSIFDQ